MRRKIKILIMASIFWSLLAGGCGGKEIAEEPITILAILMGNHANSKKFNVQLGDKIEQAYSSFGNVCIICVDGKPETVRDAENSVMMAGCYDAEYLKDSRDDYRYKEIWERDYLNPQILKLNNYLEECSADDPEVDTLEAFHSAVIALNEMDSIVRKANNDAEIRKEIVVFDTGLSTTGCLNFLNRDCLLLMKNEKKLDSDDIGKNKVTEFVNNLDANAELPELSDISVTWYGLGEVDKPQPELSKLDTTNLRYIWSEILRKADAVPSDDKSAKADYFVQIKGYEAEISEEVVTPVIWWEDIGSTGSEEEIVIEEEEIGFIANSSEYSSMDTAVQVLRPYAQNLMNYADMRILLLGTTSSFNGGSVGLSAERAEKVKQTLVELGVPEGQIDTVGVGYHQDFCENDSPNGIFVEEIGKNNRAVSILPLNSEKAQRALSESN